MQKGIALVKKILQFKQPLRRVMVSHYGEADLPFQEAQDREQDAYARGRAEAEAFAQKQIVEMREDYLQMQAAVFNKLEARFEELVERVHQQVPRLAFAIVERIWGDLILPPEQVKKILDDILAEAAPDGETVDVFLCPEDLESLNKLDGDLADHYPHIRFVGDPKLKVGDCKLLSRFGFIDGSVATKLKKLKQDISQ